MPGIREEGWAKKQGADPPLSSRGKLARRKGNIVGAIGPPRDRDLMKQLAAEWKQFSRDLLPQFGVDLRMLEEAEKLAQRKTRIQASGKVLERIQALSRVLAAWQQDKRYQGDAAPKVLPIRGRAPSFQSLLKEMAPGIAIEEALQILVEQSDVRLVKGNKVSLLGSTTVLAPKSPEMFLAVLMVHFRRFLDTAMKNSLIPPGVKGEGWYARDFTARMTKAEALAFLRSIRVPLDDVMALAQGQTEDRPRLRDGKHNIGVSVFVWEE